MNLFISHFKKSFFAALSADRLAGDIVNIGFCALGIKLMGWTGLLATCDLPSATWPQAFGVAFLLTFAKPV